MKYYVPVQLDAALKVTYSYCLDRRLLIGFVQVKMAWDVAFQSQNSDEAIINVAEWYGLHYLVDRIML